MVVMVICKDFPANESVVMVIRKDFPENESVPKPTANEERVIGFLR